MARDIQIYNGTVTAPNSDYPNGRIKDDTGTDNGTDCNEQSNGDMQQFFAKMMRESALSYNNLPDNEYSGNQFFQALRKSCRPYYSYVAFLNQVANGAPTSQAQESELGTVSWVRNGIGVYTGTFSVAFPNKCIVLVSSGIPGRISTDAPLSGSVTLNITTYDWTGAAADNIMFNSAIEIRCYKP